MKKELEFRKTYYFVVALNALQIASILTLLLLTHYQSSATIDRVDATEEEIRASVRKTCETYGPGGHFIPCITYGLAGTIYPHVDPIITDEISRYNKETYNV